MKIIDFEKRGNLVRFYLGKDDLDNWYGDDWNDRPYEYNAGIVYPEFESGYCDIVFPFNKIVAEPRNDYRNHGNSDWCKDDMRERKVPCIVVVNRDDYWGEDEFSRFVADANAVKYYFGDHMDPSDEIVVFKDKMAECSCYHIENGLSVCWGTKEKDVCNCYGDKSKCSFYGKEVVR